MIPPPGRTPERTQLLVDVITTAVEGGVNYWASVSRYVWGPHDVQSTEAPHAAATLHDNEDTANGHFELTVDAMARAFDLLCERRDIVGVGDSDWRRRMTAMYLEPDGEHDFDAGDADALVQIAWFGDVRYG